MATKLNEVITTLPQFVWTTRPDGGLDSANLRMLHYLGPVTEEFRRDWRTFVHAEDRLQIASVEEGGGFETEALYPPLRLRRHDGAYRWFQCNSLPIDGTAGTRCIVGADIHDNVLAISDLRHRESAIRAIVECIPGFVWQLGQDGQLDFLNTKVFEYTGKSLEGLRDPGWRDSLHPEDIDGFIAQWMAAMQTGASITIEFRLRRADGVYRWFRTFGEPVRDLGGEITGWCGVDIDIDDGKRVASQLRGAQAQLVRTAQLAVAAELTASTADAVNQPLAAIVANAFACQRWLSATPPNIERATPIMDLIVQDSKAAAAIVARILAVIRRTPAAPTVIDVNSAIEEALRLLADELKESRTAVHLAFATVLQPIKANGALLQQVIVNLIRNSMDALKARNLESRTIVIKTITADGKTCVEVADNGIGFAERAPLFDAFYTSKPDALGLGLAVARSIVESYAGHVWALHNTPTGAIVGFGIPLPSG